MKKFKSIAAVLIIGLTLSSCDYVQPNYVGVKQENYGKEGKADFHLVKGKVNTWGPGTELYQVPLFEQTGGGFEKPLNLKSSDNQPFTALPKYSFEIIEEKAIDVVFYNKHLGKDEEFLQGLQDKVIEPRMYDVIKEKSREKLNDSLMKGNLAFEKWCTLEITKLLAEKGIRLITFSLNLDFPKAVSQKLEQRSEMNSNLENLKIKVAEQKLKNELAEAEVQGKLIYSRGLTKEILQEQWIKKWDGVLPNTITGNSGVMMTIPTQK